jgi:hypothetical protein
MCETTFTPSKGWSMARTAGQMPRRLNSCDYGARARSVFPLLVGKSGGDPTVQALACSGLVALLGLPALLIASMASGAPLAAPAAIATGFLATSHSITSENQRGATAITLVVLVALVVWSSGVMLTGGGSRAVFAAALLAPLFAAAPWLARLALARRADTATRTARRSTECLDRLAPGEAVLIVRRDGSLLASTRAARANLCLSDADIGRDVGRSFGLLDRPKLSAAVTQSIPGGKPIAVTLQDGGGGSSGSQISTAEISPGEGGTVCIRLASVATASSHRDPAAAPTCAVEAERDLPTSAQGPACDAADAVDFARRHAEADLSAREVELTASVDPSIAICCERQVCRRILVLMLEAALANAEPGDALRLSVRVVKSVVLIQLTATATSGTAGGEFEEDAPELSAIRQLAEAAGGTVIADRSQGEARISVRFALASGTWRQAA